MSYQDFKAEWNGRRVDYDHVYGFQCVDLILEYVKECFGIASGVYGNAIDYWYKTPGILLPKFDRISTTDCQQGDIVVLYGNPGNPYGHIGICDHEDASNGYLLEQNALGTGDGLGKSAIGVWRAIPKSRIVGVLRPKPSVPQGGGTAEAIRPAYVRVAPTTTARLGGSQLLNTGDTFKYTAKVFGQDVNQNGVHTNIWYHSAMGNYVWSGNCKDI